MGQGISVYVCMYVCMYVCVPTPTELKIVVCHRSFSDPLQHMTEQIPI